MATKGSGGRRRRRGKARSKETVLVVGLDLLGGGISQVEVSAEVGLRYIDLHRVVPPDISRWSEGQVRRLAGELGPEVSRRRWESALILLAHHRSPLARDLLLELGPRVPVTVQEFHKIALGESQSWLDGGGSKGARVSSPGSFVWGSGRAN